MRDIPLNNVFKVERIAKSSGYDEHFLQRLTRVSVRLAELSIQLPRSVTISGVLLLDGKPRGGGSFADIYQGRYGNNVVAVKKLRMSVYESKDSWVSVARVCAVIQIPCKACIG